MKVLILTVSTGQGHIQTGKAISSYFSGRGAQCEVLDAYKYISPFISDSLEKGYLLSTQYAPKAFGAMYELLENKRHRGGHFSFLSVMNNAITSSKLSGYISESKPDVIISTHIFCATVMTYLREELPKVLNIGIVTDFTLHPFWEETDLDYYVTANHLLNNQCRKKGIPADRILPIGIPIDGKFSTKLSKEEARARLAIENKPTILFMMGSMGFGNMPKLVRDMDELELEFQILCVCGKNAAAKRKVEGISTRHEVYVYGFVDNVDVMMDAADFIITKPGGLSMSESLAKGLPAILVNPIPGHENRNLEFFLNNGISMYVTKTFPIDEAVYQMLSNRWKMENVPRGAGYIGKPNAVSDLYEFITEKGLTE